MCIRDSINAEYGVYFFSTKKQRRRRDLSTTKRMLRMRLFSLILVLGLIGSVFSELSTIKYDNERKLHSYYTLWWSIDNAAETIYLKVEVKRAGWVGFGIGEQTSGGMTGADIMHAAIEGGEITMWDKYVLEEHLPPYEDHCSDWIIIGGEESNGNTIVEFKRKFDTTDPQDRPFVAGDMRIIGAWGGRDHFEYHGPNNRFMTTINFFTEEANNTLPEEPEDEIIFNAYVQASEEVVLCTTYPYVFNEPKHLVRIESIVNVDVIQAIFYGCTGNSTWIQERSKTAQACQTIPQECNQILWVWNEGYDSLEMPEKAGYLFSNATDGYKYVLIQTLYHNEDSAYYDNSRFNLTFIEPREFNAGVLQLGNPWMQGPGIKEKETQTTFQYTCPQECTNKWSNDITVFGDSFYLFSYGVRTLSVVNADTTNVLNSIEFYSENTNQITPVSKVIKKGERIDTFCVYNSASNLQEISFGRGHEEITCNEYLYYYPKLDQDLSVCSYAAGGKSYCGPSYFVNGAVIDQQNPSSKVEIPSRLFGTEGTQCEKAVGIVKRNTGALVGICIASTAIVIGMTSILLFIALRSKDDQMVHRQYAEEH
eukprot:TRINITY_DN77_c0_g3_i2.p1 TRINITY_DN77_c0_g3~~TRINITY_DN77_c0_g3_i2.p1  ORF type:complete len:594 (-),score=159.22 TRINITY_DN77_c0_g3_i2:114-1895(-)